MRKRRIIMRLQDNIAIITGAAQGIGKAFALGFAREGAKVVIADILDGEDAVRQIEEAGGQAIFVKTDITSQDQCNALAEAAKERFGTIDVLVNNAAVFADIIVKPFTEVTTDEWNRVMQINTTGPFHCVKAVFPYMKEKGGKIINISSSVILEAPPGLPHYVASKGAVMAFTRAMARELGEFNINVNSIAPSFTLSAGGQKFRSKLPMPPEEIDTMQMMQKCLKRVAYPEDLVGTALFLASEDSSYITGQMILHDGGMNFI
jgi:NAD(P)-dependent dehydrogenase (short-subunit alcohol dehydrogenase family)